MISTPRPPTPNEPVEPVEPVETFHSREELEGVLADLVGNLQISIVQKKSLLSMLATIETFAREGTPTGDLKIADAALSEMSEAFKVFRPYRQIRKATMFGSARTSEDDPVYFLAREIAAKLALSNWMVVTGAGPGIMAAGIEGAGRDRSFGVTIELPHEEAPNPFIAQDPKLMHMRYFFTRKLMLIKESHAYIALPGGFGTQDECFELLTLLQTGKAEPAPLVLVDTPGGTYWKHWKEFLLKEAVVPGWISPEDLFLFRIASTPDEVTDEIFSFYRNYHSCRWVGNLLVIRVKRSLSDKVLDELNHRFIDIVVSGKIHSTAPLPPERAGHDFLELPRIALRFDKHHYARLRLMIDFINEASLDEHSSA